MIVPCYNSQKQYLDRLMGTLLHQTIGLENLEILLVNDGSSNNTKEWLQEYEKENPDHICVISYEENKRPGYARSLGIQYASGEYVAFADQDDWVEYVMYEKLYEKAKEYDCDVVSAYYTREEVYQKPTGDVKRGKTDQYVALMEENTRRMAIMGQVMRGGYWSCIYKRQMLIDSNIYFPEGLMWDDNFFGALVPYYAKDCYILEENLYHWYVNLQSISMVNSVEQVSHRMQIEILKIKEFAKRGFLSKYQQEIAYSFFHMFYMNTLHVAFTKLEGNPYEIYVQLRRTLIQLFPDISENKYIQTLTPQVLDKHQYDNWEEFVGNAEGEILEYCSLVPDSIHYMSWMDTVYRELTEREVEGWKIRYLLINIGF